MFQAAFLFGEVKLRLLYRVFVDFRGIVTVYLYAEFTEGYLTATHSIENGQYVHFSVSTFVANGLIFSKSSL